MSLDQLRQQMRWPTQADILSPRGAGPAVLAKLAREKIEGALRGPSGGSVDVHVGILTKNPDSDRTEAPLAVVCEFARGVSDATLADCHGLAWNFVRSPLLVTVEPHQVRTWTCCEPPATKRGLPGVLGNSAEIDEARLDLTRELSPSQQAEHALHWVRLASGDFYRRFPGRFRRDGRADRVLLEQLTSVRKELEDQRLDKDRIHDLLARVVFSQFLFDRKDSDGRAAINPALLSRLHEQGHLAQSHEELGSILGDYNEAYKFFRWLNDKFNGDLFPGKGRTPEEREGEWQKEMRQVKHKHLQTLADFVSGRLLGKQRVLWRHYSFDVIPLEFISSIYEEFVTTKGAHYTPGYLVDFMLDEVLPWGEKKWDLKILDPACGSGIFLVKAYQRLIQRWKNAHPGEKPSTGLLKKLLEKNLFGVDIDKHAVRVASFSLYLTMCDELDPKKYLTSTKFPPLRDQRLIHADFFQESINGFSTNRDRPTYDLVIGNAPWTVGTETEAATKWARNANHNWPIANKQVGTLFLAKAATLTKPDGRVSMIQPASALLFNRTGPASRFRERLFSQFKVEEVVNLSTLRFELFDGATSPSCIVTLRPTEPDDEPLLYISPKRVKEAGGAEVAESQYTIVIEPHDISRIWPEEAASEPIVWTALAWGGRRDLALLRKLCSLPTMEKLEKTAEHGLVSRRGVSRGASKRKRQPQILNMPMVDNDGPLDDAFLLLDARTLPPNADEWTHESDSTDMSAFELPQLIVKQSWQKHSQRFKAAIVNSDKATGPVFCTRSYFSVHVDTSEKETLDAIWLSLNSSLAVYYLLLTSGRLASWIPEPNKEDFMRIPLPSVSADLLKDITPEDVDNRAHQAFALNSAESTLVDDLFTFTMPDFQGNATSPGRQPTQQRPKLKSVVGREPQLAAYCQHFIRVLKAGFGQDKAVCATVFQSPAATPLPVRLVAIHLDLPRDDAIIVEPINSESLCQRLLELDEKLLHTGDTGQGGIFYQRVALVYSELQHEGRSIPTVYIVKPDRIRYWTRSAALRDADEVAADVQLWRQQTQAGGRGRK